MDTLRDMLPNVLANHDVPVVEFKYNGTNVEITGALTNHSTDSLENDIAAILKAGPKFKCRASIYNLGEVIFKDEMATHLLRLNRGSNTFTLDAELKKVWLQYPDQLPVVNAFSGEHRLSKFIPDGDTIEVVTP